MIGRLRRWWNARQDLRSFGAEATESRNLLRWHAEMELTEALDIARHGGHIRARTVWEAQRAIAPEVVLRFPASIELLLEIGAYDEAEATLAEARSRYRPTPAQAQQWALVADRRGDRATALLRWEDARRRFPSVPGVFSGYGACLAAAGRLDEAETLLQRAVRRFPEDLLCRIEYARVAASRKDWAVALERWRFVRDDLANDFGITGMGAALRELGRFDEADQLLADSQTRAPLDVGIAIERARVAEQRGDAPEAARRWADARRRFPKAVGLWRDEVRALRAIGEEAEAEARLGEAVRNFPEEYDLAAEHAALAERRGDWEEAARRWALMRERFPDRPLGYDRGANAEAAAGHPEVATAIREAWLSRQTAAGG